MSVFKGRTNEPN